MWLINSADAGTGTLFIAFVLFGGAICFYSAILLFLSIYHKELQTSKKNIIFFLIWYILYIPFFFYPSFYSYALSEIEEVICILLYPAAIFFLIKPKLSVLKNNALKFIQR